MDFQGARETVLRHLQAAGRAKNSELLPILGGDRELLESIREDLVFDGLAEDVRGVGLRYSGPSETPQPEAAAERVKLFLSYGRRDAKELADRLCVDLAAAGYDVWQDTREIDSGTSWQQEIVDGLRSAQLVIALMTPHSVRTTGSADSPDNVDSVCLGEISYALFNPPPQPVVPVMAETCEPPLAIFHLDYVDMRAWSESADQYQAGLRRLLSGIEAARRGERRYRSWYHQLNPFDFAAFLHPKRQDFCGRQWLFDRIDAWRVAHQRERALLIKGDPGTGKSAVVAELVHRNPGGQVLAYHCCQWDVAETLEPWRFIRSVAAMIASKLDDYAAMLQEPVLQEALSADHCRAYPESALEEGVLSPLQRLTAPEDGPRYLLVDALDEALLVEPGSRNIVDLLASRLDRFPPWLKIVATTRNEAPVLRRLSGLRAEEIDAMSPENLDDIRRYIAHRLDMPNLAEQLAAGRAAAAQVVEALCGKSAGNFLYVQQALDGIERGIHRLDALDALPPGLAGLYELRFDRQFPDAQRFAAARHVLDVVVAAGEPLARGQIAAATGLDEEEELPAVLKRLSAYVPSRAADGQERRYAAYHKSLIDWLADPERRDETHSASPRRGHQKLAEMGWAEYRRGPHEMSPYALAHLPMHLIGARRWDDLETLLTDIFFLEAKTGAGRVFELAGDFNAAVEALPELRPQRRILKLLDEALRRDIHFIARHAKDYPQGLFQCLWNSCWWYDCDEAAKHYEQGRAPGLPSAGRSKGGEAASFPQPITAPAAVAGDEGNLAPLPFPNELRLCGLPERWRDRKDQATPGFLWLRSHRPPPVHLGTAQRAVLRGHETGVTSVAFSPQGDRIASGSTDTTVRVWDAQSGAELAMLRGHEITVTSVAFSPQGDRIASGSDDNTVRLWDAQSGEELAVLRGHEQAVNSVAFSPQGDRIASGSSDKTVRLWDAQSGDELAVLRGHEGRVNSVVFSPQGDRITSGSDDNTVRLWDAQSGEELAVLRGHEQAVNSVAFSPQGDRIASGSSDKTVRLWDAQSGEELAVLRGHENDVFSVSVALSPQGDRITSWSDDNTVRVWDAQSGAELTVLRGHESPVLSVAFSPKGSRIASGSADTTVRLWDAQSGEELAVLRGHDYAVKGLAFSPQGDRIASGSYDKTVRVWDAQGGAELAVLRGHEKVVNSVAFSPQEDRITSWSDDNTVRVWDAQSGEELEVIHGTGDVRAIAARLEFPYRALGRTLETVIERSADGQMVAWFPVSLGHIVTHPSGRTWVGVDKRHLHIITLEGGDTLGPGNSPRPLRPTPELKKSV